MNRKILTLLIVLFAVVSIASVCASEELKTSDFDGKFKMDIPEGSNITSDSGNLNQSFYVVMMGDLTSFAVEHYDDASGGDSDNITDYVLNTVYKNDTKTSKGNITTWDADVPNRGHNNFYAVSSQDDKEVVVVIGNDIRLSDCISSVSFE